jgi:hypothetical protein
VGFVADRVAQGQFSLWVLWLSRQCYSLMCHLVMECGPVSGHILQRRKSHPIITNCDGRGIIGYLF